MSCFRCRVLGLGPGHVDLALTTRVFSAEGIYSTKCENRDKSSKQDPQ